MSLNKIIVYLLIFVFAVALFATFPKGSKDLRSKVEIFFGRKHFEEIARAERDPFKYKIKRSGATGRQIKLSDIVIKGIIWDDKKPSAAISINNEKAVFVREGDKINRIKILRIERDKIIIDEYGRRTINFK